MNHQSSACAGHLNRGVRRERREKHQEGQSRHIKKVNFSKGGLPTALHGKIRKIQKRDNEMDSNAFAQVSPLCKKYKI